MEVNLEEPELGGVGGVGDPKIKRSSSVDVSRACVSSVFVSVTKPQVDLS